MAKSRSETAFLYILSVICLLHLAAGQTFQYSRGWTNGKKRSSPDFQADEIPSLGSNLPNLRSYSDKDFDLMEKVPNMAEDDVTGLSAAENHFVVSKKREPARWVKNKIIEEANENLRLKNMLRRLNAMVNVLASLQLERKY